MSPSVGTIEIELIMDVGTCIVDVKANVGTGVDVVRKVGTGVDVVRNVPYGGQAPNV